MYGFNVTYEIVTQESAEQGDSADSGFIAENVPLREAIDLFQQCRTSRCGSGDGIEADEFPIRAPRGFTCYNGMEYETGDYESRSLHIPDSVTDASRRRIARLLGLRVPRR